MPHYVSPTLNKSGVSASPHKCFEPRRIVALKCLPPTATSSTYIQNSYARLTLLLHTLTPKSSHFMSSSRAK